VNAKPDIRDALLVQRMSHWLLRAKHGPIDNCPKRRGRKNYLFLVREHKALAQQNHFRESDVYLR
jgi:Rad3-related DNA helicase